MCCEIFSACLIPTVMMEANEVIIILFLMDGNVIHILDNVRSTTRKTKLRNVKKNNCNKNTK